MNNLVPAKVQNILNLEQHLIVKDGIIQQTPELIKYLQITKSLKSQIKASESYLRDQMVDNGIKNFKGDWGSMSLARGLKWSVIGSLAPRFYKKTIDTSRLKAYYVAMNKLPNGVDVSETYKLSPKIK